MSPTILLRRAVALFWRFIAFLERKAPRAVWMAVPCVVGFQSWRVWPDQDPRAIPTYAAGGLLILLAMRAFRYRLPDAAFTMVAGLALLSGVCVMQGELELARVMCGGVLVVLILCSAGAIEEPMDKALAFGQGVTLLAWFAGNANRGTFGYDVARSALGQAYGWWAEPALWLVILAGYLTILWYNSREKDA